MYIEPKEGWLERVKKFSGCLLPFTLWLQSFDDRNHAGPPAESKSPSDQFLRRQDRLLTYLSKLRRDSIGAESIGPQAGDSPRSWCTIEITSEAVSQGFLGAPAISAIFPIFAVELLNHNSLKYYQKFIN